MGVGSAWTTAGVGVLLVGVVASCGGGSADRADVDAGIGSSASFGQAEPGSPVGEVLVGEDAAWIVGSGGGDDSADEIDIWRLAPGTAEPELVGSVPALQGASHAVAVEGVDGPGGVELAGWSCDDGEPAETAGCDAAVAELVRVDAAGEVIDEVTLSEKDGPLDPSDSVAIVGTTAGATWVAVDESIVEVGASGEVLATVPTSWGEHCVIGDRLYGLVDPNAPTTGGSSEGAIVTDSRQAAAVVSSFQVEEHADIDAGDWQPVAGGASGDFEPGEVLAGFCGDGRFDVTTPGGDLVATWTPGAGWARVAASADRPAAADVEGESAEGGFVVLDDGAVVERESDGAYEPTGLDLRAPADFDPTSGPVVLSADASDRLVAACVTWPESPETAITTCDLTRR
jgi:hypothetical protein